MEKNYSGVSQYTNNLLENIFDLDESNQYILFYNSSKKVSVPEFNYPNVKKIKFDYPNKLLNASQKFLQTPKIDKMIGGVDVFFMPNLLFASLSERVKKIVTIHDLSFERYPAFYSAKERLWHHLVNPKKLCQTANIIIAVSQNTKNDIVDLYGIEQDKVKVVYSGVSKKYHQIQNSEKLEQVKAKYNLPENFVLYLGNIENRKNIESVISTTKKLNINLVIAGQGTAHKGVSHVKYIGYVKEEEKPVLYTIASILIYPSFYEGFGFPPLEAMACGTPVICSLSSSLPEIVESAGILVNPYNSVELTFAIKNIMSDTNLYQKLKNNGFKQAKNFSWKKCAEDHIKLFKSI